MLYYELPVYKDVYRLVQNLYSLTHGYPKEFRYSLVPDICSGARSLVKYIYLANKDRAMRKAYLEQFLQALELLKLDLRLSVDFKCITIRQYESLNVLVAGIGRQVNGWMGELRIMES